LVEVELAVADPIMCVKSLLVQSVTNVKECLFKSLLTRFSFPNCEC